jgi:hypothetical protein
LSLEDEVKRGRDAEYLLEHPLFVEAHATLRAEIIRQWEAAPITDLDGQHRLLIMLKLLDRLRGHIATIAETGKLATKQLADIDKRRRILGLTL